MATKSQLEAENQRLQDKVDELHAEIDRLKEPAEEIGTDIDLAVEKFQSAVNKAADELKQDLKRLVSKTPA